MPVLKSTLVIYSFQRDDHGSPKNSLMLKEQELHKGERWPWSNTCFSDLLMINTSDTLFWITFPFTKAKSWKDEHFYSNNMSCRMCNNLDIYIIWLEIWVGAVSGYNLGTGDNKREVFQSRKLNLSYFLQGKAHLTDRP